MTCYSLGCDQAGTAFLKITLHIQHFMWDMQSYTE